MEGQFSFKSFENVRLKATYNMEVGNRHIEEGETIAIFDKIQIAGLSETVARVTANGGFDNRAHVFWETVQEQKLTFAQGIFNKTQFALLTNARVIENGNEAPLMLTLREMLESDADGKITLREVPLQSIFVYDVNNGGRLEFIQDGNVLTISTPYTDVIVDYNYNYSNNAEVFLLGSKYFNGFVSLEGLTRVKDDTTGQVVTGVIKIPHLKLMSDLSIRLGAQANPVVANFMATGVPVGSRGNTYVSEFYLLSDDIMSDL